jgi:hypothetical protein
MNVRTAVGVAFACFAIASAAPGADAALDLIPAPGAAPMHLRVAQTIPGGAGPQMTTADVVLRRTGPGTVMLERNADVSPLLIGADGSLRPDAGAAPREGDLDDILAALNIAHGVTGVAGAGNRDGWTGQIPLPVRSAPGDAPSPFSSPSPAAPLLLPVHAVAVDGNGDLDIDGSVQTTLSASEPTTPHRSHSHGGFGGGGFGGFGGRGGFGGSRGEGDGSGEGEGPPRGAAPPIDLDIHVAGRLARNALARLTITQTRRVVLAGLTYTNVENWTIDAVH